MARGPGFSADEARAAIEASWSWSEALRRLGYCPTGGNPATLKKYAAIWRIPTDHFDPHHSIRASARRRRVPLGEILVQRSRFSRNRIKDRLYKAGLKEPKCELCGQGEQWRGKHMSLILDHVNGIRDDNRIENLRVVCPNCAATLDTHCGRSKLSAPPLRNCLVCGEMFRAKERTQKYCSLRCAGKARGHAQLGVGRPGTRKVPRPPFEQLMDEIGATSYLAVGRKYGVSDNAVRRWVRFYEQRAGRGRGNRQ